MRIVFYLLLIIGYLSAGERFTSIHQIDTRSGYTSFKDQILHAGSTLKLKTDYLPYSTSYRITCQDENCIDIKNPHEQHWCNTRWMRYRIYVPPHLKKLQVFFYVKNNSSHAGFMYFIPDGSSLRSVDFRDFKYLYEKYYNGGYDFVSPQESISYLFSGYNPLFFALYNIDGNYIWENVNSYVQNGGWLYITLAQADQIMRSEGFKTDPKIKLYIYYTFDDTDKMEWLRYIKFDAYGDPVENFNTLQEIQKTCSETLITTIYGNNEGEYIFDPNIPSFSVSQTPHSSTIDYEVEFTAGEAPIYGVDPETNSNLTISATLNNCIQLRSQPTSNNANGEFFYSEDNQHWVNAYLPGHNYIRYELAPVDSSGVVLSPQDTIKLNLSVQKSGCTNAQASFVVKYSRDGQTKQKNKTLEYTFSVASVASTSSSSTSRNSSSTSSSSTDESAEQQECEENGGMWLDHLCFYSSSSSRRSSSSSYRHSSSSSASVETRSEQEEQQECEENGGMWLDHLCFYPSSSQDSTSSSESSESSTASSTSSAEDSPQRPYEIASQLAGKSYEITGYFIYFGDPENYDPFAWIYTNKTFTLVSKLEGSKPDGGFKWTRLMSNRYNIHVFENVTMEDGVVKFGAKVDFEPGEQLSEDERRAYQIASQLAGKSYEITGYFIYYGDPENYDPFAWIYTNKTFTLVSKLEGSKPDGGFKWTRLMSNRYNIHVFENVTMEDGVVKFGALREPLPGADGPIENEDSTSSSVSSTSSSSSSSEESSSSSQESSSSVSSSSEDSSSSNVTQSSSSAESSENAGQNAANPHL